MAIRPASMFADDSEGSFAYNLRTINGTVSPIDLPLLKSDRKSAKR